ncbi:MAG: LamG domain-containing protein [Verrucomicrobia bacterium]|nr:LamG domain-containing protein [Verrucomicrobiota bacterium]
MRSQRLACCTATCCRRLFNTLLFITASLVAAADMVEPCFYASWDESLSADRSAGATGPVKAGLAETDPKSARKGKAGLNAKVEGAHVDYATKGMWPSKDGTVAFWYRPHFDPPTNTTRHGLLYATTEKNPTANQFNIRFDSSQSPYDELQVVYQSNGEVKMAIIKPKWKAGEWRHVAVTWDKEDILVFIDGVESGRADMASSFHDITQPLVVGSVFGNDANADFDELTIYPKSLDPEEISKLAKAP